MVYDPSRAPPPPGMMQTTSIPAQPGGVPMPSLQRGQLGPQVAPGLGIGRDPNARMEDRQGFLDMLQAWQATRPEMNGPDDLAAFQAWVAQRPDRRTYKEGGYAPLTPEQTPYAVTAAPNMAPTPAPYPMNPQKQALYAGQSQIAPAVMPGGVPISPGGFPAGGYSAPLPPQGQGFSPPQFPGAPSGFGSQVTQGLANRTRPSTGGGFFGTRKGR